MSLCEPVAEEDSPSQDGYRHNVQGANWVVGFHADRQVVSIMLNHNTWLWKTYLSGNQQSRKHMSTVRMNHIQFMIPIVRHISNSVWPLYGPSFALRLAPSNVNATDTMN